jgi:hypothetical protein
MPWESTGFVFIRLLDTAAQADRTLQLKDASGASVAQPVTAVERPVIAETILNFVLFLDRFFACTLRAFCSGPSTPELTCSTHQPLLASTFSCGDAY